MIAATNRPDMIDPAMVRPGRLDKLLYVDLPSAGERAEIIRTLLRKVPLGSMNDASESSPDMIKEEIERVVGERCDGFSGADLAALVREAGVVALKRTLGALDDMDDDAEISKSPKVVVDMLDFLQALDKVGPSVSVAQRRRYENLRSKFAGLPVRIGKDDEDKLVDVHS